MNRIKIGTVTLAVLLAASSVSAREVIDFDAGWRFTPGDPAGAESVGHRDASWRMLKVPHDWAFEADYAEDAAQGGQGGYKPGGIGWYRKSFKFPERWAGKRVIIAFDAVYMNSEVWINGQYLGKRPYGYISFEYEISKHLKPGENVIAVRVDNSREPSARWYHGCGIYGHVKLLVTDAVYIPRDGVCVRTAEITDAAAKVVVETELSSTLPSAPGATLVTEILDPDGKVVAEVTAQAKTGTTVKQTLIVPRPKRWDTTSPHLYQVVSRVKATNHEHADEVTTRFGIRDIQWKKDTGFWLNGRVVKLKGVADHSEAGPVGAAWPDELLRWKLEQIKAMGCNSIRTAHNPQTPIFYDLCDEMGILVLDEIFDGWNKKAPEDYGKQAFKQWWERDLRAWLKRDRNHPCVIGWCLGNETGGPIAPKIVAVCHELDPTRLVTSGHANPEEMDIEGVNGHSEYSHFFQHHAKKINKPFVSTEAPHTWQVRGFYRSKTWLRDGMKRGVFPLPDLTSKEIFTYDWTAPANRKNRKQIFNSSYDNATVRITARQNWELMRDLPWHSGHYRWTGIDYLGEASYVHGGWPFRAFMGGALDLALFPKDLFYFYQSQWTTEPMVHILPHWTHPRMEEGTKIPVWVYSNCDEVELFLNGKSLGRDKPGTKWDEMQCDWMVPWTPGTIEAVGYKGGKEVVRASHRTAGVPARLALSVHGKTCPIITVTQQDKQGVMNPYAENRMHYHVEGPARILSLESGNPVNTENNYGRSSRTAFFGLTRAFLQTAGKGEPLSVIIGAICGEKQLMTSDQISIDVKRLAIRGQFAQRAFDILYSTDGSKPSKKYTEPFSVEPGTIVKADVFDGGKLIFSMEEGFGPKEGIYWGDETADTINYGGDQAEEAKFKRAVISTKGKGFEGKGYLNFGGHTGAYVEWYQENDGSPGPATLSIRYSGKRPDTKGRSMQLSVNDEKQELFFQNTKGYGTDWSTLDVKIQLKSGANRIRITTIERGGMCIDSIEIK
jgi:beta-galactosidase